MCENRAGSIIKMNRAKRRRLEKSLAEVIQQHKLQSFCNQIKIECYSRIIWDEPWEDREEDVLQYVYLRLLILLFREIVLL